MNVGELIELLKSYREDMPVKIIVADYVSQKQGDVEEVFDAVSAVVICGYESK